MKNVHFIGIGGIHMNGMARLLQDGGYNVSGSDMRPSETTKLLEKHGIKIFIGHDAANITDDVDTVVFTAAVPPDNPELVRAREANKTVLERAEMLGAIMKDYENVVCVSGCHGKTTATSMLTDIFLSSDLDPTCIVGGQVRSLGDCLKIGGKKYFIAEACEYFDAFLRFRPTVGVILNVELDHADYFGTLERVRQSFKTFAEKTPQNGALIINSDIDALPYFTENVRGEIITFGTQNNPDWTYKNVTVDDLGHATFDAYFKGSFFSRPTLGIAGEHHIYNALASLAVCEFLSRTNTNFPSPATLNSVLSDFRGAKRRFEFIGTTNGANIFDDYSHHPTEIRATVKTALKMPKNRLWCVFQPHTKRRTKEHLNDFAEAFKGADKVLLLDIYIPNGRDDATPVTSRDLAKLIGENCLYLPSFDDAKKYILENISENDMLITMGAGDVNNIAYSLTNTTLSTL